MTKTPGIPRDAHRVPIRIEMRLIGKREDHRLHELSVGVVGTEQALTAVIVSQSYDRARIVSPSSAGCLELRPKLRDALLLLCFKLITSLLIEHDDRSGWWTIGDVTRVIRKNFDCDDAEETIAELSRNVRHQSHVRDECLVSEGEDV